MGDRMTASVAGHDGAANPVPGSAAPALIVSEDGYLRLTLARFRAIHLRHLISELDEDAPLNGPEAAGATTACIAGFTEWISDTNPALSLGWDWRLDTSSGRDARYVRAGEVRSNVMLCEPGIGDLGDLATSATLCAAVDALAWQAATHDHITKRYG